MHYYQFNIGDYASHTQHLDELEDLAYRRMLDYCYLNEIGLPEDVAEIARLIRMRTHCERIANVLREYFTLHSDGTWRHARVERELGAFREKSGKAAESARKRWEKSMRTHSERNANAMHSECEGNANHKPLTNNHKPRTIEENAGKPAERGKPLPSKRFTPPSLDDLILEFMGKVHDPHAEAVKFLGYYESNGWRVGKNPMKNWKSAVAGWAIRASQATGPPRSGLTLESVTDRSWAEG